jgi:hypothetical protein
MTAGAKPYTMKVVRTVFNGGDEETGLCRPRLVATQLECGFFSLSDQEALQVLPGIHDARAAPLSGHPTRGAEPAQ